MTPQQMSDTIELVRKFGGIRPAARAIGVGESTIRSRYNKALEETQRNTDSESAELRNKVFELQAALKLARESTIDDEYVKRKIIGLSSSLSATEPPGWLLDKPEHRSSIGVPTLLCSDWHWGEVVDRNQVNGLNEFNTQIAHRRARTLISKTIDLLQAHQVAPDYPGIVLALAGDLVSGGIHDELAASDEAPIMPTVIDLYGVLIWCIDQLRGRFGRVFVPCVTGNHDRSTTKTWHKHRNYTSYSWLLYQFLAKHYSGARDVTFLIPDSADALYSIYGTSYLLTHGDTLGKGGDGLIGFVGPVFRGAHRRRTRNSQAHMPFDVLLHGHFHSYMSTPKIISNGSLVGYSEYSYANGFGYEVPTQALWLTHPKYGITFSMPVYLETPKLQEKSEWVSWKEN